MEVIMNKSGAGIVSLSEIGIDPQNRNSTDASPILIPGTNSEDFTTFTLRVPYKVDA